MGGQGNPSIGALVAGRFALEAEAGVGGMGRVFRARDITTGECVALKLLDTRTPSALRRFRREAALLCGLSHPSIVRYVAHGDSAGQPYLAMEWLAGVDLEAHLSQTPLSVVDAIAICRSVAEALAHAHRAGVVHRDVKPSNIFLVDGLLARAKLLDFGVARDQHATLGLTQTGAIVGTPAYMAPEQATAAFDVDERADVYGLGGVLFTCLTGRTPFMAANVPAMLAKIVLEDAPDLSALRPDVPRPLAALCASMLAKDASARPENGGAVRAAFDGLTLDDAGAWVPVPTLREQRVVCVVLATSSEGASIHHQRTVDRTIDAGGGVLTPLADGSCVVTIAGPESPSDLAVRAVRSALALRQSSRAVAVTTGRSVLLGGAAMGELFDRAAIATRAPCEGVRIDDVTADLIEGRSVVTRDSHGAVVRALLDDAEDRARTLLGKPTRVVGRARELAMLSGYYDECVAESMSRALLVVGEAGVGKSRLCLELVARLAKHDTPPSVLCARATSVSRGQPFAMVAAALRRAAGMVDGDDLDARRRKLADHLARIDGADELDVFLAEMAGFHQADEPSDELRAAMEGPALMHERILGAWLGWLDALTRGAPTLLVVEDLHWGDAPSVALIEAALTKLASRALLVVALARPEVDASFAHLWSARAPHVIALDRLTDRAAAELARAALGQDADDDLVAAVVQRAGGNAFFVEELVRAAAHGDIARVPEGVIGVVQLRFDVLSDGARGALFAASALGETFARPTVQALVPASLSAAHALDELVGAELVAATGEHGSYRFRHALTRDAAYALLSTSDRERVHALAAEHLEAEGARDPVVLAGHFEQGAMPSRAARWLLRAAEQALDGNDMATVVAHARKAARLGSRQTHPGMAELLIADAEIWRGQLDEARRVCEEALALVVPESASWFKAAGLMMTISGQTGDNATVADWVERLMRTPGSEVDASTRTLSMARGITQLPWAGLGEIAQRALAHLDAIVGDQPLTPLAEARRQFAHAYSAYDVGRLDLCIASIRRAEASYARAGSPRDVVQCAMLASMFEGFCGLFDEAITHMNQYLLQARALDAAYLVEWTAFEIAMMHALKGDLAAADELWGTLSDGLLAQPLFAGGQFVVRAHHHLLHASFDALAKEVARVADMPFSERYRAAREAFAARVALARGEREQALQGARHAVEVLDATHCMRVDLHHAGYAPAIDVLAELDHEAARRVAAEQARRLRDLAAEMNDAELRAGFLGAVPWNRRTLAQAAAWGLPADP